MLLLFSLWSVIMFVPSCDGDYFKEILVFNALEWSLICRGLDLAIASARRLSARAGQPESVSAEYRKVIGEYDLVMSKCRAEMAKVVKK